MKKKRFQSRKSHVVSRELVLHTKRGKSKGTIIIPLPKAKRMNA